MGNIFGSSKSKKDSKAAPAPVVAAHVITDHDRAVLQLTVQRDRLHKYTGSIALVIAREVAVAKELLKAGKKSNALLALKRKRYQERLLERTEGQMLNLEEMVHSLQFASMQAQVFAALSAGNSVLNALNAQTRLEDVEQLMDDTREAVEYQQQVSQLMGSEISQADVDDIENTLQEWEAQDIQDNMPLVPVTPPAVAAVAVATPPPAVIQVAAAPATAAAALAATEAAKSAVQPQSAEASPEELDELDALMAESEAAPAAAPAAAPVKAKAKPTKQREAVLA